MPNYNYYCKRCDGNHTERRKYEERNKSSICPDCGKRQCPMTFDNSKNKDGSTGVFIKGGTPKFYGSTEARKKVEKRWLEDEVKNADNATKGETGVSPYSNMKIDHEYWEKQGVAKKVSAKEARQRKKNARKLTQHAAKNVNSENVERMTKGGKEGVRKGKE